MRRIRALPYLLAALLLTSCGTDSGTNPSENPLVGTFILQSVNGNGLPFSTQRVGGVYTLGSSWIAFRLPREFTQSLTVTTVTQSGQTIGPATFLEYGTFLYTASTQAVSLRRSDGIQFVGSVANDTMTLVEDGGGTFVFKRQ